MTDSKENKKNIYEPMINIRDKKCKKKSISHKYKNDNVMFSVIKQNKKDINIVGYFKNKKLADENDDCIEFKSSNNEIYRYKVTQKRELFVQGYINVGENNYIGYIKTRLYLIFIFLFCILLSIGIATKIIPMQDIINDIKIIGQNINEDVPQGTGITNYEDMLRGKSEQHSISVPQFSSLFIYQDTYVPLINLPQNDILIMYEVYDTSNNLVFASKKPLVPNSEDEWYLTGYEKGTYDFVVKAFKVYEQDDKLVKGNSIVFNTTIHILN